MMDTSSRYCPTCGALQTAAALTCLACGSTLSDAEPEAAESPARPRSGQLPPSHLLQGRFRILKRVGAGGFGAVYQGEDTEAGNRRVAIKEMSHAGLSPRDLQEATDAFHREADLLRELAHPSLPRIYAHFSEGGNWYLVMDFIQGETLEESLTRQGGHLPLKEVIDLGIQLCEVLEYLHTRQPPVIFRDLKPANVMLTPHRRVYLIDFGIARHFTPGKQHDTIAFGSPGYAAPEQYGKAQTSPRSDIFSLGALLHHLLTGTDPSEQPMRFAPITGQVPTELAWLIAQMVDLDPAQRPASMAAIKAALERLRDDWQRQQAPASTLSSAPPVLVSTPATYQPSNRRRYLIGTILVLVILAIIGSCFATQQATAPVGITNVKVGVGDRSGIILYESDTFSTTDLLVVNFTATTHDSTSAVEITLVDQSNTLQPFRDSLALNTGTHDYYFVLIPPSLAGTYTLKLYYNAGLAYSILLTVTSPTAPVGSVPPGVCFGCTHEDRSGRSISWM